MVKWHKLDNHNNEIECSPGDPDGLPENAMDVEEPAGLLASIIPEGELYKLLKLPDGQRQEAIRCRMRELLYERRRRYEHAGH